MAKRSRRLSKTRGGLKLKKVEWLGIKHDEVVKRFEGDLTFVNYINVGDGGDLVAAVYHAKKPNLEKGHKEFMLLWMDMNDRLVVSGMTREQIEKHATVTGMHCLDCDQVIFSLNRHHFHGCKCENEMFVDGGKDYLRAGAIDLSRTRQVQINLLTDEITVDTKARKR